MNDNLFPRLFLTIICSFIFFAERLEAQIVPDDTLGTESSQVNSISELRDRIEGGAIRGDNLFHSFQEFKIDEGLEAYFANPEDATNIFSRVTGSNISEIFGTLGVEGTANLFLINPNGIVFGENASLNVGGSFIATTAESIEFADDTNFATTDRQIEPVLTIEFPIGLGFGSNPGNITVRGEGHNLILNTTAATFRTPTFSNLQVDSGKTLALIGGNIILDGGVLLSENGHIELGAGASGTVEFDSSSLTNFQYNFGQGRDIELLNRALVDTSGAFGGSINAIGENIVIRSASGFFIQNTIEEQSGNINVEATSLEITGGNTQPTLLFDEGVIELFSDSQIIRNGFINKTPIPSGTLLSEALITFALRIEEARSLITFTPSFIYGESFLKGQGSNMQINVENLLVSGGAQLITRSFDNADTGAILIDGGAKIEVAGASNTPGFAEQNFEIFSQINSTTFGSGTGGNIDLNTNILITRDGGSVSTATIGVGNGGNLDIKAGTIDLLGSVPDVFIPSSIAATSGSQGNAGNLKVNATNIFLRDGASISTSTLASGNAGQLEIYAAESIEISGIDSNTNLPSSISSAGGLLPPEISEAFFLPPFPTGDAGRVTILAEEIFVFQDGQITVTNLGMGNAGELSINADKIILDNNSALSASTASGEGGNIMIDSNQLELLDRSQISASAGGTGNGGNITIDTDTILGLENSDITANAFEGNGGNIEITADGIVGLEARTQLTSFSDITAESELGIDGTVTLDSPDTNTEDELVISAREINSNSYRELIEGSCLDRERPGRERLIIIGKGVPESPDNFFDGEPITTGVVERENTPSQQSNNDLPKLPKEGEPLIEPNAVQINPDGRKFLVAVTEVPTSVSEAGVCTRNAEDLE